MARRLRVPQLLLAIGGLVLVGALINGIGWGPIRSAIGEIGLPAAVGLVLLYGLAQLSFCLGWYWTLGSWREELGLRGILIPFLAGDAVNCSIPSANAAGEPIRVMMLKHRIPMEDAAASVSLYKFSDFLSMAAFLAVGLAVSWFSVRLPVIWFWGGAVVLFGMGAVAALLVGLGSAGLFRIVLKLFARIFASQRLQPVQAAAAAIDESLRRLYGRHRTEFLISFAFNLLGWFGGVIEAFLCLWLLGLPASWTHALAIETFALFINNVTFFVPARIGVIEGSRAAIFAALGLPAASGMAYGIVRRMREVAWIALGYSLLSSYWPHSLAGEPGRQHA